LYEKADDWASYIVVDGNLYTGQNVSLSFFSFSCFPRREQREKDDASLTSTLPFLLSSQPASAHPLAERIKIDLLA